MRRGTIIAIGALLLAGLIAGNLIGQYVQSIRPMFEVAK